jgi:hypothetical protein
MLSSPFDPDYAAGEKLDNLLAWEETGVLYSSLDTSSGPFRVSHYSPLFFTVVRFASSVGFDPLASGRLLNLLAMGATLFLTFRWLRNYGLNTLWALFGISLSSSNVALLFFAGQMDIQWLAVGLSLAGLFMLDRYEDVGRTFLSGVLCGLGCLTKQTQIVPALIGGLWLAKYRQRRLCPFLAGFLLLGAVGLIWIQEEFGREAWRHIITYAVGAFSVRNFANHVSENIVPWCCFFAFGILEGCVHKESRKELRWWYFVGTSLGLLSAARLGASYQYFIEWELATILWIMPWLARIATEGRIFARPILKHLVVFLIVGQVFAGDIYTLVVLKKRATEHISDVQVFPYVCKALIGAENPLVVSETVGMVRACGLIPALHPFIMTNLSHRGLWDQQAFVARLSARKYPFVLLPFDPQDLAQAFRHRRWTKEMIEAIQQNYFVAEQHGRFRVLRPKSTPISVEGTNQPLDIAKSPR